MKIVILTILFTFSFSSFSETIETLDKRIRQHRCEVFYYPQKSSFLIDNWFKSFSRNSKYNKDRIHRYFLNYKQEYKELGVKRFFVKAADDDYMTSIVKSDDRFGGLLFYDPNYKQLSWKQDIGRKLVQPIPRFVTKNILKMDRAYELSPAMSYLYRAERKLYRYHLRLTNPVKLAYFITLPSSLLIYLYAADTFIDNAEIEQMNEFFNELEGYTRDNYRFEDIQNQYVENLEKLKKGQLSFFEVLTDFQTLVKDARQRIGNSLTPQEHKRRAAFFYKKMMITHNAIMEKLQDDFDLKEGQQITERMANHFIRRVDRDFKYEIFDELLTLNKHYYTNELRLAQIKLDYTFKNKEFVDFREIDASAHRQYDHIISYDIEEDEDKKSIKQLLIAPTFHVTLDSYNYSAHDVPLDERKVDLSRVKELTSTDRRDTFAVGIRYEYLVHNLENMIKKQDFSPITKLGFDSNFIRIYGTKGSLKDKKLLNMFRIDLDFQKMLKRREIKGIRTKKIFKGKDTGEFLYIQDIHADFAKDLPPPKVEKKEEEKSEAK